MKPSRKSTNVADLQTLNNFPQKDLARHEWDFRPDQIEEVPEGQLLPMLNYEYARCHKPVLTAVRLLKQDRRTKLPDGSSVPAFARYLAHVFPEFPETAWMKLEPSKQTERLKLLGIDENTRLYSQEPAWQSWGAFDPQALSFVEELTNFQAECYGVFKLD